MSGKGFVMTLDAIIALSLLTLVMLTVMSQASRYGERAFDSIYLRSFSMNMLSTFEKSGLLEQGLYQPSRLRVALNALPYNICAQITLMKYTNVTMVDLQKEGCGVVSGTSYVTYRTFYNNGTLYMAKSSAWSK